MHRLAIEADGGPAAPSPAGWRSMIVGLLGPRGTLAALVAAGILGLSLLVVSGLPTKVRAWVHERPEYAWSIDRIELDPEPPAWLRPRRDGVLASVATPLRAFDRGSALDLELGAVERAFKNVAWVDRVRAVRRSFPDRVVVALDYRDPVAIARLDPIEGMSSASTEAEYLLVDGDGLILDRVPVTSELGRSFAAELIVLSGLDRPSTPEIGQPWPARDSSGTIDPAARASARLSRFLLDRADRDGWPESPSGQSLAFRNVSALDGDPGKLYLAHTLPDGKVLWVFWKSAPGAEDRDEPAADEKWRMLRNWIASGGTDSIPKSGALGFTARGPAWLQAL